MYIPINDFESHIPDQILDRGQKYWENKQFEITTNSPLKVEAIVFGTDDYEVCLTIEKGTIIEADCDCPYDHGDICKHIAAVCFELREHPPAKSKTRLSKKKLLLEQIVDKLDEVELRTLLLQLVRKNPKIEGQLLLQFGHLVAKHDQNHYQQLVKGIIKPYLRGRHGFIEYREAVKLGKELEQLINQTDSSGSQGYTSLVYMCEAIIKQVVEVSQSADDSSGYMGGAISEAFGQLREIISIVPLDITTHIHQLARKEWKRKCYDGYDWEYQWQDILLKSIQTEEEATELIYEMDSWYEKKIQERFGNYSAEQAALNVLQLLEVWKGAAKAEAYLGKHIHLPRFRKLAIEKAMENQAYERVRELAEEGIRQHTEEKLPGLVSEWEKWLQKLARKTGDKTSLITSVEKEFLGRRGNISHYRELKQMLSAEQFAKKVNEWLAYFEKGVYARWFNTRIADIYIEEFRFSDLMIMLRKHISYDLLDEYSPYLLQLYPEEYQELYARLIINQMERNTGRGEYVKACRYIKKIYEMGAMQQSEELILMLEEKYPRRRALKEELQKLKTSLTSQ